MSRSLRAIALAAAIAVAAAVPAWAHQGNPNYRSVIDGISPTVPGVKFQVLGYDTQFQVTNHSGKTVTVYGYGGEPYIRILPDGTVQQNHLSPATYLNASDFVTEAAPSFTSTKAAPQWRYVEKTGTYIWHDHRMHWMGAHRPPQVKDKHKKTKVFDYQVPISVGTQKGQISGTLYWVGSQGGFPVGAIVSLIAVVLLGVAGTMLVRRRRAGSRPQAAAPQPVEEAW
jgi:hypothetical protein